MAMTRSSYQKFRAAAGTITSQSNYALTLARKQQAAEDDYYDYAYTNGNLTADQYITQLTQRRARMGLTPLQLQNINQKIEQVQADYQDSLIQTAYKTGATYNGQKVDTTFILNREKEKLAKMTIGSEAYNKQQALIESYTQKLQGEEDAATKSQRKQYRMNELNKLSTMRQESSQELTAKANMYEQLQAMAQADGEADEALGYETQKNNLKQAAEKAAVNERIQDVIVQNSTPIAPMSNQLTPAAINQANQGVVGTTPPATNATQPDQPTEQPASDKPEMVTYGGIQMTRDVYEELTKSSELSSFLERNAKDIRKVNGESGKNNGLNNAIASQLNLVNVYKSELNNASPDNRDVLLKGYNDAVERYNTLIQQRDDVLSGIEERQGTFGELVSKKVASIMKNKDAAFERELDAAIKKTQDDFSAGKLPLDKYLEDMYNNFTAGSLRYEQQSQLYEQVNDGVGMSSASQKAVKYGDSLNYVNSELIPNKDNLRVVQSDETNDSTINLAKGAPGVRKGEFILENPTQGATTEEEARLKLQEWDKTHIQQKGVWFPVRYNFDAVDKGLTTEESKKRFAEANNLYVYKKIENGKDVNVPIKAVDYGNGLTRYVPEVDVNKYLESGSFKQQGTKIVNLGGETPSDFNLLKSIGEEVKKNITNPSELLDSAKQNLKGVGSFLVNAINNTPAASFNRWLDSKSSKATSSITAPKLSLVKPAYAAETPKANNAYPIASMKDGTVKYSDGTVRKADVSVSAPSGSIADIINKAAEKYAPGDEEFRKVLHAIALAESGGNPNAIGDGGVSIGLFQNNMAGGRGYGHKKEDLLNPEYNANLSAADLIKYYKQGISKGLSGSNLVAYVSKYGQRPAAGLEANAAKNYGRLVGTSVSQAINEPSVARQVKTVSVAPEIKLPQIVKPVYAAENQPAPQSQPQMSSASNQQSKNTDNVAPWVNSSQAPKASVPTPAPTPVMTPAKQVQNKAAVSTPAPKYTPPIATPAPTPAPKPVAKVSTPAPAPQNNGFISQAKNAVSNAVSSVSNLLKKIKFW